MTLNIRDAVRKWGPEYLATCGLAKYFPTMNAESSVFFVSEDGNDDVGNYGQTPDTPLLTVTKALSFCTTLKNDYIFVLSHYQNSGETWPIVVNKRAVHIVAPGWGSPNNPRPYFKPETASKQAFDITHGPCELAGLEIAGYDGSYSAIKMGGAGWWGIWIHHCNLGTASQGAALHGIEVGLNTEMLYSCIENNIFGINIASDGINIAALAGPNSIKGLVIRNNHFRVSGIGINIDDASADFDDGGIFNNTFSISTDTVGKAIDIVASVTGGMIDGNVAGMESNEASVSNNPYRTITACGPAWGLNYRGGSELAISPALA